MHLVHLLWTRFVGIIPPLPMTSFNPYLVFNGTCEAALNFYAQALGGEIISMDRFASVPDHTFAAEEQNRVMHAQFRAGAVFFMASDNMPGSLVQSGHQVALAIGFDNAEAQTKAFNGLAEGGTIVMPLEDTFWNARFGILNDQFGIQWMFNYDYPAK